MARCNFCGSEIERGTGKTVIQKDGSMLDFCSSKCEKNLLKLKRNPAKFKWTFKSRKLRGKLKASEEIIEEKPKKVAEGPKRAVFKEEGAEQAEEKKE